MPMLRLPHLAATLIASVIVAATAAAQLADAPTPSLDLFMNEDPKTPPTEQTVTDSSGTSSDTPDQTIPEPIASENTTPADDDSIFNIEAARYTVLQDRPDRLLVQLSNRMIILAQEVHAAPVVSAQVWVKTGSIYEQEHVGAGLSHFLEHLLAGGSTATRSEEQTNTILGAIGAQTNAATSLDTVRYYINTTSDHTAQAVELLSDWMQSSVIKDAEYERERAVIQREFEMGQGEPGRILWKLTQQARFTIHPARHPTIGYLDEFMDVSRDEIYEFYRRMYVPNNLVFVVVGDIDKQAVVDQVAAMWNRINPRDLPPMTLPVEPDPEGPRKLTGVAGIDKPRLRLAWPGTKLAGDGDYAMDLLASILGQGESSRLVRTVRDEQRAVNNISAYNLSFSWGKGFFGVDAEIAVPPIPPDARATEHQWQQRHIDQARQAILEQVAKLQEEGPTDAELARAKRKALASVVIGNQSVQAIASRLARDMIGMKDPDYLHRYARAIQAVSANQVRAAAKHFLSPNRLIDITLAPAPPGQKPEPLTRPQEPEHAELFTRAPIDIDNRTITNHLHVLNAMGPAPASMLIEVQPVRRYTLPNGMHLLVGRSTVVPAVAIQVYHIGGLLADPPGQEGLANATASMLVKGSYNLNTRQIAQHIEDLGAQLTTQGGNNSTYTQAVCLKEDWPALLDLIADITLRASFPTDEWEKLRPRILAAIESQSDTWSGELRRYFRMTYFEEHPWSVAPLGRAESVAGFTTDDLRRYHKENLGADRTVIAVFGDVDPDRVMQHVKKVFASIPKTAKRPFVPAAPTTATTQTKDIATNKPLAAVQIGFGPTPARTDPDFAAVRVLSKTLSSFPAGWLEQELRGKGPGLAYAVGAGQFTGLVPGYFAVVFNTQPETVQDALDRVDSVINRARDTLVDDETLNRSKAKVLADEFLHKQSNSDRAADAALNEMYGLPIDESERFRRLVQHMTAKQLQNTARKYLNNPVTVILRHQATPTEPPVSE